ADPLTGVRVQWRRRLSDTDPKHVWELHRQQHLVPLSIAGDATGVAAAQLGDWLARNPRRAGGPAWSSGYETARRLVGWAGAVGAESLEPPPFGDDAEDRILRLEYFEPRRAGTIVGRARTLLDGRVSLVPAPVAPSGGSVVLESGVAVLRRGAVRVAF